MPGGRGISTITFVTIAEKTNGTTQLSYRYCLLLRFRCCARNRVTAIRNVFTNATRGVAGS
ncbi:hypothetical protein EL75_4015 [Escherichia coli]|nr:hypothetical protein EL75_4015 [Escherichia coli]KGM76968.1 hypothetical protein EL80_4109 [Escherichia coli]KGM79519.1 hypothetical protein EL79_4193 [Escherichia coli]